jgi:hypothetical protein
MTTRTNFLALATIAFLAASLLISRGAAQSPKPAEDPKLSVEAYIHKHELWLKSLQAEKEKLETELKEFKKKESEDLASAGRDLGAVEGRLSKVEKKQTEDEELLPLWDRSFPT